MHQPCTLAPDVRYTVYIVYVQVLETTKSHSESHWSLTSLYRPSSKELQREREDGYMEGCDISKYCDYIAKAVTQVALSGLILSHCKHISMVQVMTLMSNVPEGYEETPETDE